MPVRSTKQHSHIGQGLRTTAATAIFLVILLFFLPLLVLRSPPLYGQEDAQNAQSGRSEADGAAAQAVNPRDKGRPVRLKTSDGSIEELSMDQYLWRVVAAEMPASFEEEALKAQTCAARTYTVSRQSHPTDKHPDADICADSSCCQAYIRPEEAQLRWGLNAKLFGDKISAAVSGTDGLGILYQGQPIQALFFSSAAGKTVDAVEVWGNAVDYLKSVDSPEGDEVPNYHSQAVLSPQQVRNLTLAAYPSADLSGPPENWFGQAECNGGGSVISMTLGGITLTGGQLRNLFSLRSTAFTVSWDGNQFTFDVTGYGHGVGMSQYGANAMAKAGSSFQDILTWYYTGAEVAPLW